MRNFCIFAAAVNYIEENLCSPITQEEIAAECCCSLSALQKVWRYCSHTGIKEYITKRRLTCCAKEIAKGGSTLIEIAMKYGYNSPEVFTRAFRKLWGVSPSEFKRNWHSTGLFPRIIPDEDRLEGGIYMGRRVDVSELYEQLKANPDSYVLCCDVVGLTPVNDNFGRNCGDAVIREAFRRIDEAAGDEMTAFRIGGDEFALMTGLSDPEAAKAVGLKIISKNGEPVECEGNSIPVSLRVGALRLNSEHLRYSDLFSSLQAAINSTRDAGKIIFANE